MHLHPAAAGGRAPPGQQPCVLGHSVSDRPQRPEGQRQFLRDGGALLRPGGGDDGRKPGEGAAGAAGGATEAGARDSVDDQAVQPRDGVHVPDQTRQRRVRDD